MFIIVTPFQQNTTDPAQMTHETHNTALIAEVRDLSTSAELHFTDGHILQVRETFAEINEKLGAR